MASPLLSLPYELRVYIYELVLCTQGTVQLVGHHTRKRRRESLDSIEWDIQQRYAQKPASPYPPGNTGNLAHGAGVTDEPPHYWVDDEDAGGDHDDFEHLLVQRRDRPVASERLPNSVENYGIHMNDGGIGLSGDCESSDSDSSLADEEECGIDWGEVRSGPDLLSESDDGLDDDDDYDDDIDLEIDSYVSHRTSDPRASNLDRFGYDLELVKPINLALLLTCHEIHADATPVFYAGVNFVMDTDPTRAIRFLKTLPALALRNITTLTLPPANLDASYLRSAAGWAVSKTAQLYCTGCPSMYTPFGAFLANEMPKLTDIYAYSIMVSDPGLSCTSAFTELERLLCHGRINRLHYMSMGEHAVETLESKPSSREALGSLIDAVGVQAAHEEFDQYHSMPTFKDPLSPTREELQERDRQERGGWYDKQMRYVRRHCDLFDWKWGDRDIEMSAGTMQAVITAWLKKGRVASDRLR